MEIIYVKPLPFVLSLLLSLSGIYHRQEMVVVDGDISKLCELFFADLVILTTASSPFSSANELISSYLG